MEGRKEELQKRALSLSLATRRKTPDESLEN